MLVGAFPVQGSRDSPADQCSYTPASTSGLVLGH